jgi:signal transduction histidine kinase
MTDTPKIQVLVTDDDPGDRLLYRRYLELSRVAEYDIFEAEDIASAQTIVREQSIDVALIDYRLGPDSGVTLIEEFAKAPGSPSMVLLTGQGDIETDIAAAQAGAIDYVDKGQLSAETLERTVRYALLQKKALEQQQEAREAAEELVKAKSDLLAQVSHDFRTPLNAIIGFADIMSTSAVGDVDPERYAEYARIISGSGHHLLSLVNHLLLSSQLDQGNLILDVRQVDLSTLAQQTAEMLTETANRKNIELNTHIENGVFCNSDSRSIKQILINLISNAIKFTDRGSVSLSVKRENSDWVIISVSDTGPGISKDDMGRLTEAFFQSDSDRSKARSGTGLGLSIVKGLTDAHLGQLAFESEVGKGSVFTVRLPRKGPVRNHDAVSGS